MLPRTKITLTDAQKYEFCLYAHRNPGNRTEYVNWIENKWNVRVSESTVSRILQQKDKPGNCTSILNATGKYERSIECANILERYIREKRVSSMQQLNLDQYFK